MKFLLACCGSASNRSSPARAEETLLSLELPSPPRDSRRYRKRGRAAVRSQSAKYWRPSLGSISEDSEAAAERGQGRRSVGGSDRMLKRKVGSTTTTTTTTTTHRANNHVRSYSDDFGGGFSTIMPSFSPTPFFF